MELEEFLPFNLLMAFQTVLEEVLEFKLQQNCLQQHSLCCSELSLEVVCI